MRVAQGHWVRVTLRGGAGWRGVGHGCFGTRLVTLAWMHDATRIDAQSAYDPNAVGGNV